MRCQCSHQKKLTATLNHHYFFFSSLFLSSDELLSALTAYGFRFVYEIVKKAIIYVY